MATPVEKLILAATAAGLRKMDIARALVRAPTTIQTWWSGVSEPTPEAQKEIVAITEAIVAARKAKELPPPPRLTGRARQRHVIKTLAQFRA